MPIRQSIKSANYSAVIHYKQQVTMPKEQIYKYPAIIQNNQNQSTWLSPPLHIDTVEMRVSLLSPYN